MSDPRFPIGQFTFEEPVTAAKRVAWIDRIASLPATLRISVGGLTDGQLDTPYRDGGWTVRQVVHHLPDSHLNAYIRCKLALTESTPTIKPYDEARWADLPDSAGPIEMSLDLLEHLHTRWTTLLRELPGSAFARTFFHPESKVTFTLDRLAAFYSWHGEHHLAHITKLKERMGW